MGRTRIRSKVPSLTEARRAQVPGFIEHVQAWVLRHVLLSIILLILLVTTLFITLLWLGPPVPRD